MTNGLPRFMHSVSPQSEDPDTRHRTPAPALATSRASCVLVSCVLGLEPKTFTRLDIGHCTPRIGLILTYTPNSLAQRSGLDEHHKTQLPNLAQFVIGPPRRAQPTPRLCPIRAKKQGMSSGFHPFGGRVSRRFGADVCCGTLFLALAEWIEEAQSHLLTHLYTRPLLFLLHQSRS